MTDTLSAATPDTAPFWEAAAQGRLLIMHCNACGENHFYPRPICPFCMSADTAWLQVSGRGTIYTYTLLRRGPAPAYITLEEGPTLMSVIVDGEASPIAIGQAVKVGFQPLAEDGPILPVFTRAA